MPKQYMLFGKPIPRIGARKLMILFGGLSILAITFTALLTTSIESSPRLQAVKEKLPELPENIKNKIPTVSDIKGLSPFHTKPHPPPKKENGEDEHDGSSWWADWTWLSVPFSSTLQEDDDRMLLPPLRERTPIICYYDDTLKKSKEEKQAESALLLTWRRAWWAQGFRPIVVGVAEAMNSPLYEQMQKVDMADEVKEDMMRWMAWEAMDGGLLSYETLLPMAAVEDDTLVFLRRGEYPQLTSWKSLGSGLLAASKEDVSKAITEVMESKAAKEEKSVIDAVPTKQVITDKDASALAYYSPEVIKSKYGNFGNVSLPDREHSLKSLAQLMNSHLHISWQNQFEDGVDVVFPYQNHTRTLINSAMDFAKALTACPKSPLPHSCPPNMDSCKTCTTEVSQLTIRTPEAYGNDSTVFTIGTVPHPWTLATLEEMRTDLNISYIRRIAQRDPWLTAVTQETLGEEISSSGRVISFKETVASEFAEAHVLFLEAETASPLDVGWRFGFSLPDVKVSADQENDSSDKEKEKEIIEEAKKLIALKKSSDQTKLRASMEAWNLADTEAWRFAKAYQARRTLERLNWEKEEEKYMHGAGSEGGRKSKWGMKL